MKKTSESESVDGDPKGDDPIGAYSRAQPRAFQTICDALRALIAAALPDATSKVWHGSPVWFIGEHPVVGYSASAKTVKLLFWNGQAFDEPTLEPVGKHRAAHAVFNNPDEIDPQVIRRWLQKAKSNVLDSKAFIKALREGKR
jgi:hypothetical protein